MPTGELEETGIGGRDVRARGGGDAFLLFLFVQAAPDTYSMRFICPQILTQALPAGEERMRLYLIYWYEST